MNIIVLQYAYKKLNKFLCSNQSQGNVSRQDETFFIKRITISYENSSILIVPLDFLYSLMKQVCVGIQNYERSSISFIILFVSLLQFPLWSKVNVLVLLMSHIKNNIRQLKIILSKICFLECFLEWICLFLFHWPNFKSLV